MILFKDWYKKANDDIQPNEELLARILAQNSLKRPARRKLYPLGVAAAGICIVSAAILSYPVLRDLNKERSSDILPPDNAVVVTHQPAETDLPDGTPVVTAAPVQAAESTILPKKQAENTKTAEKTSKPKKTIVPQKTQTPTVKPKAPEKTQTPIQTEAPAQPSLQVKDVQEQPEEQNTSVPAVKGVTSDQVDLVSREWTKADYAAYLGVDVAAKLTVPADLENITPETRNMSVFAETQEPYYDIWAYKYRSADGARALTVKTTKMETNLPAVRGEEITIGGAAAVVSKTEIGAEVVFHNGGVWYMVKAEGLSEEEWMESCKSIMGQGEQE